MIMAGRGQRLRPLTCDQPKPMARLCGRPVMAYILDLLEDSGVREAAVTLRYLPNPSPHFGEQYGGVALSFTKRSSRWGRQAECA